MRYDCCSRYWQPILEHDGLTYHFCSQECHEAGSYAANYLNDCPAMVSDGICCSHGIRRECGRQWRARRDSRHATERTRERIINATRDVPCVIPNGLTISLIALLGHQE